MNWTDEQESVIKARDCNLLVSAAAGSGKTAVLVERIIQKVFDTSNPIDVDQLLVVTFTKAAASQMKDKITAAIEKKLSEQPDNDHYIKQLSLVSQANILTIDSFCYKVVKEYFNAVGLDPKIKVAEETELVTIRQDVIDRVMEDFYKENPDFVEFSDAFSEDKNDNNIEGYILDMYELSQSYPQPFEWLDKARENYAVTTEEEFDNLIFVKEYYRQVKHQATDIKETILDAIKLCNAPMGPAHYEDALRSDILLVDDIISARTYSQFHSLNEESFAKLGRAKKGAELDDDIVLQVKTIRDKYKKKISSILDNFSVPIEEVLDELSNQKAMMNAYIDSVEEFSRRFMDAKLEAGLLGFSDVEHFALSILSDGKDELGNVIPSTIGQELSKRFAEVMIDEYQDSNFLQEDILKCVSGIYEGNNNMFMVGDVKQSIYGFRMARPDLFLDKYTKYSDEKSAPERRILLKRNFRSRANVLNCINYIFYRIMMKDIGGIDYDEDVALVPGREYVESFGDEVELLIGESKEAEYFDADNTPTDEEHLNDEYIDVSSLELEACMVADRIKKLFDDDYKVVDDKTGELRPVSYRDIVLLFRSPKSYQPVFCEVLMRRGIPVRVQNENGYFDSTEIRGIMSFLNVLDNPYNDLDFTAALRGYYGMLDVDELSCVLLDKRAVCKKQDIKTALYAYVRDYVCDDNYLPNICEVDWTQIRKKCKAVIDKIDYYEKEKRIKSASEIIREILYNDRYYYYVLAMPEGSVRCRNLELFLDQTVKYEKNSYRTLFDFIRFMKKLADKDVSLGGDPTVETSDDIVRIMSIHKSKGLEFPVVILAGLAKNFNLSDSKNAIVFHPDYYISSKYIDVKKRRGKNTFSRSAFASLIREDNIAEELRVLYVALTRAKEKLIMTGVVKDIPKLINNYSMAARKNKVFLDYGKILNSANYMDWIVQALIRNTTFNKAMDDVRKRYDKNDNIVSASYELVNPLEIGSARFAVKTFDYDSMLVSHIETSVERDSERNDILADFIDSKGGNEDTLKQRLNEVYAKQIYTTQKSKMSVTEIQRLYEKKESAVERPVEFEKYTSDDYKIAVPVFVSGKLPMTPAERGTWFHKFMEIIDNSYIDSEEKALEVTRKIYDEGRVPVELKAILTADKLWTFASSSIGARMREADRRGELYKERKFVVGVPADFALGNVDEIEVTTADDVIVVQGIIDAYFEEEDGLVLVDYKTDKVDEGKEEVLAQRYKTQMNYYSKTLERLTGKPVKEIYLYSFALGKPIQITGA
ncbi:MAG: helicase-exonuclease AddAB subunit AddA [Lachnospiraceae bacterium]|nr:helicase-exonuclease AddAB subunit AddA [Lachnospiraceae bacterium]